MVAAKLRSVAADIAKMYQNQSENPVKRFLTFDWMVPIGGEYQLIEQPQAN